MTSTIKDGGERFLHILNLDGFDKEVHVFEKGLELFEGRKVLLQSKRGLMLPHNVTFHDVTIFIVIDTKRDIVSSKDYEVRGTGDMKLIVSLKNAKVDDNLKVSFR